MEIKRNFVFIKERNDKDKESGKTLCMMDSCINIMETSAPIYRCLA